MANDGFYSFDGIIRQLVDGILLPAQLCNACSVEVLLCFGTTLLDFCCNCDESCPTPYNSYLVSNGNAFGVIVGLHNEDGIHQEIVLPANATGVEVCSTGYPTSSTSNVTVTFNSCFCSTGCDAPTIVVGAGGYGIYKVDINVGTGIGALWLIGIVTNIIPLPKQVRHIKKYQIHLVYTVIEGMRLEWCIWMIF